MTDWLDGWMERVREGSFINMESYYYDEYVIFDTTWTLLSLLGLCYLSCARIHTPHVGVYFILSSD